MKRASKDALLYGATQAAAGTASSVDDVPIASTGGPHEAEGGPTPGRRHLRLIVGVSVVVDLMALAAALAFSTTVRLGAGRLGLLPGTRVSVWLPAMWLGLVGAGLYDRHRTENPAEELRNVVRGVTLGATIALIASYSASYSAPRSWVLLVWVASLTTVAAGRRTLRKSVHALRRRGFLRRRALIVGADATGRALADAIDRSPWEGLDVAGYIAVDGYDVTGLRAGDVVVGATESLARLVRELDVRDVLVAPSVAGNGRLGSVIAALDGIRVDLRIAPGLEGFLPSRIVVLPLGDRPLLAIERVELRPVQRMVKRALDLAGGIVALAAALPVIAACAVAIRLDSPGPIFFRQRRVGIGGTEFTVLKLRTMAVDAEQRLAQLRAANQAQGPLFKMRDDPRVTRVGRFLRRTSLDELPQLFNVLAGTMSLVGPRPPLPEEVAQYDERLVRRLLVKPGMTGLWQVKGRHQLSFDDYVRYDLLYVQNWSVALDVYILAKTIPAVLSRRGAF